MIGTALLIKGLIAALVVGFVTASIKTWVDRVFLIIMLVGILGLPIGDAITVNLVVISLAALVMVFRQRQALSLVGKALDAEWLLVVIPAVIGGIGGRLLGASLAPKILLAVLGIYAILVGLRIFLIKPKPPRAVAAPLALLSPVALGSGFFAGLISAGAKPFAVPLYNNAMGHKPPRAYAFASLGVVAGAWAALGTQFFVALPSSQDLVLALYEFVLVTIVALIVNRFWSEKLNKVVNLIIAPILILVGIRFFIMAIH